MKAKAFVSLPFRSEKHIAALTDALNPEIRRQIGIRSTTKLISDNMSLLIEVEAEDTVALRAALNAYLRWISSTTKVLEKIEHFP